MEEVTPFVTTMLQLSGIVRDKRMFAPWVAGKKVDGGDDWLLTILVKYSVMS